MKVALISLVAAILGLEALIYFMDGYSRIGWTISVAMNGDFSDFSWSISRYLLLWAIIFGTSWYHAWEVKKEKETIITTLEKDAKVFQKRIYNSQVSSEYFISFQVMDKRYEFKVDGSQYGILKEGEWGVLEYREYVLNHQLKKREFVSFKYQTTREEIRGDLN